MMNVCRMLLVSILVMSGCLDNGFEQTGPNATVSTSESPPTAGPTSTPSPIVSSGDNKTAAPNLGLLLTDCFGIETAFDMPPALVDAEVPPTWGSRDDAITVNINIHRCNRVAVGPFERGPVHVLWEYHNNIAADIPEKCREGDFDSPRILYTIWLDDQEIVDYLRQTYSMPAEFAVFEYNQNVVGNASTEHWEFGLPGMASSTLESPDLNTPAWFSASFVRRLFWVNDVDGITYLEYDDTSVLDNGSPPFGSGVIRPPLLYNNLGVEDYAGTTSPTVGVEGHGQFYGFRDLECKEPL